METRKIASMLIVMMLLAPGLATVMGAEGLTVETDKGYYTPGEEVKIFGTTDNNATVHIQVNSTLGEEFSADVEPDEEEGEYGVEFQLEEDATIGTYTVNVTQEEQTAEIAFTVAPEDLSETAWNLIQLANRTKERVEEAFDKLDVVPEDAWGDYTQGNKTLNDAKSLFVAENYEEAIQAAHESLSYFKAALRIVIKDVKDTAIGVSEQVRGTLELRHGIDRASKLAEKLRTTIACLENEGYNVTEIEAKLEEALDHLEKAVEYYSDGDLEAGYEELQEANELLDEVMDLLMEMTEDYKAKQLERFMAQVENRIENMEQWIERLRNGIPDDKASAALNALRNQARNLLRVRENLTGGDVDGALKGLDDVVDGIDEGLDDLDGEGLSQHLRTLYRLQAKAQSLNETAKREDAQGKGVSDAVKNKIRETERLIEEALKRLQEGDESGIKDAIKDAKKNLRGPTKKTDVLQKLIDQMRRKQNRSKK